MKTGEDRLTSFGKIRGRDEIPDQSEIRYCRYYRGTYGHPERFTNREAVDDTVLDTKGGNSHDVYDVWRRRFISFRSSRRRDLPCTVSAAMQMMVFLLTCRSRNRNIRATFARTANAMEIEMET